MTKDLHVCPDFFGNRSPLADPLMRGSVVGLGLSCGVDDLALLYLATLQSLAYQTKHIIDTCQEAGHAPITSIFVTGGLVKNPLYLQVCNSVYLSLSPSLCLCLMGVGPPPSPVFS